MKMTRRRLRGRGTARGQVCLAVLWMLEVEGNAPLSLEGYFLMNSQRVRRGSTLVGIGKSASLLSAWRSKHGRMLFQRNLPQLTLGRGQGIVVVAIFI
jgi:hypothetical protein